MTCSRFVALVAVALMPANSVLGGLADDEHRSQPPDCLEIRIGGGHPADESRGTVCTTVDEVRTMLVAKRAPDNKLELNGYYVNPRRPRSHDRVETTLPRGARTGVGVGIAILKDGSFLVVSSIGFRPATVVVKYLLNVPLSRLESGLKSLLDKEWLAFTVESADGAEKPVVLWIRKRDKAEFLQFWPPRQFRVRGA